MIVAGSPRAVAFVREVVASGAGRSGRQQGWERVGRAQRRPGYKSLESIVVTVAYGVEYELGEISSFVRRGVREPETPPCPLCIPFLLLLLSCEWESQVRDGES